MSGIRGNKSTSMSRQQRGGPDGGSVGDEDPRDSQIRTLQQQLREANASLAFEKSVVDDLQRRLRVSQAKCAQHDAVVDARDEHWKEVAALKELETDAALEEANHRIQVLEGELRQRSCEASVSKVYQEENVRLKAALDQAQATLASERKEHTEEVDLIKRSLTVARTQLETAYRNEVAKLHSASAPPGSPKRREADGDGSTLKDLEQREANMQMVLTKYNECLQARNRLRVDNGLMKQQIDMLEVRLVGMKRQLKNHGLVEAEAEADPDMLESSLDAGEFKSEFARASRDGVRADFDENGTPDSDFGKSERKRRTGSSGGYHQRGSPDGDTERDGVHDVDGRSDNDSNDNNDNGLHDDADDDDEDDDDELVYREDDYLSGKQASRFGSQHSTSVVSGSGGASESHSIRGMQPPKLPTRQRRSRPTSATPALAAHRAHVSATSSSLASGSSARLRMPGTTADPLRSSGRSNADDRRSRRPHSAMPHLRAPPGPKGSSPPPPAFSIPSASSLASLALHGSTPVSAAVPMSGHPSLPLRRRTSATSRHEPNSAAASVPASGSALYGSSRSKSSRRLSASGTSVPSSSHSRLPIYADRPSMALGVLAQELRSTSSIFSSTISKNPILRKTRPESAVVRSVTKRSSSSSAAKRRPASARFR